MKHSLSGGREHTILFGVPSAVGSPQPQFLCAQEEKEERLIAGLAHHACLFLTSLLQVLIRSAQKRAEVVGGKTDRGLSRGRRGVPTSVGYGYGGGGQAALMALLQSCSPGLVVVNIDNGFGAGVAAALIARGAKTQGGEAG